MTSDFPQCTLPGYPRYPFIHRPICEDEQLCELCAPCLCPGSNSGRIFPKTSSHFQPPSPARASDVGRLCLVIDWLTLAPPLSLSLPPPFSSLPLAARSPPPPRFLSRALALPPSTLLPTHYPIFLSLLCPIRLSPIPPLYSLSIPLFLSLSVFPIPPTPLSCEIKNKL